jgi:hypothetical protein
VSRPPSFLGWHIDCASPRPQPPPPHTSRLALPCQLAHAMLNRSTRVASSRTLAQRCYTQRVDVSMCACVCVAFPPPFPPPSTPYRTFASLWPLVERLSRGDKERLLSELQRVLGAGS